MSATRKDPTGTFMRLIWKLYMTELEYGKSQSQQSMRLMMALKKQVDDRVKQYFLDNKDQAPTAHNVHPVNRMGVFVRKVAKWRVADNAYWQSKTPDRKDAMFALRREVDKDLEKYFAQFPDQAPVEITQPKLSLEQHRRDFQQATNLFR